MKDKIIKLLNRIFAPRITYYYWRDELKEILLSEGFDKVIEKIEQMLENNDLVIDDGRAKPL
jgi:hypothetical protein